MKYVTDNESKRAAGDRLDREETEDEPVLIDETYHLRDDGVSVIDLALRHRLATPNVDPAEYWTKAVPTRLSKPRLGNNIYLEHICNSQVSNQHIHPASFQHQHFSRSQPSRCGE